jgi:lysophospholipase L1-like esterase
MIRYVSVALALVGLVGCSGGSPQDPPVSSTGQAITADQPYLALGDSVPFGYNPVDAANDPTNLSAFVGYPELITTPSIVSNAACEGETSASFLSATAPDNGCRAWRAAGDAMHVGWGNAATQMAYATKFLGNHPTTATVSLMVGANDLIIAQNACIAQFYPDPNAINNCLAQAVPGVIASAANNIGYIVSQLRGTGYKGQIVLVTYYELQYYNQSDLTFEAAYGLDQAIVQVGQALGVSIAGGFSAFAQASAGAGYDACKAGLLYAMPDGTCNKHPSAAGQAVLAAAVKAAVPASAIPAGQVY